MWILQGAGCAVSELCTSPSLSAKAPNKHQRLAKNSKSYDGKHLPKVFPVSPAFKLVKNPLAGFCIVAEMRTRKL